MKKIIIFDLDGTLLDTLHDLQMSVNFALSHFTYPNRSLEQVRKDIGNGVAKLIERSIPGGNCDKNYAKCLEIFKRHYAENYNNFTTAYKGIPSLISQLLKEGYKVTVATNKIINVAKILLDTHYPGLFDYIEGDDVGIQKKPSPHMIENILNHYDVSKDEVLYIGDTNVDEETALNAGVDYILVTYGYRTVEEIKKTCHCTNLAFTPEELYQKIKLFN